MSVSKKNKSKGEQLGRTRVKEAKKVELSEVLSPKKGRVVKHTTHQNPRLVPEWKLPLTATPFNLYKLNLFVTKQHIVELSFLNSSHLLQNFIILP